MMEDYMIINDKLNSYLSRNASSFYCQNLLPFYYKEAEILGSCIPILNEYQKKDVIGPKKAPVDFFEGILLIKDYLHQLDPNLVKDFMGKLQSGVIQINFLDDSSREDDYNQNFLRGNWCYFGSGYQRKVCEQDIMLHLFPYSCIEIEKKEEYFTYSTLASLVHEYFHSLNIYDKNKNYITENQRILTEFFSIYFEFDFIHFMEKKGIPKENFAFDFFHRYQDTLSATKTLIDDTVMLCKLQMEGVLDQDSYKTGIITCSEKQYRQIIARYKRLIKNKKEDSFRPEVVSHYVMGSSLAYYLSSKKDITVSRKVLSMAEEVNSVSLLTTLDKVGLSGARIESLSFGNILNDMKKDYESRNKKDEKVYQKTF